MKHTFLITLCFISVILGLKAQNDTIYVTLEPPLHKRVVLYSTEGAQQKFITFNNATDGYFKIAMPANANHAMYRLVYDSKNMSYIDFLYLGQSIQMSINPELDNPIPEIKNSPENTHFNTGLNTIYEAQKELDIVHIQLFQAKTEEKKDELKASYTKAYKASEKKIKSVLDAEQNKVVRDLLYSYYRVLPEKPFENALDYLDYIKAHYFDHIDFSNPNLIHSSVLADKVIDYVFYLTVAKDYDRQNELYKEAVDSVMNKIPDDLLRKSFMQSLIQSFAKDENVAVIDHIFKKHYDVLPSGLKNASWRSDILNELSTAISRPAKDFKIETKDKGVNSLYDIKGFDQYILVFWSTTCPHCTKEVPKLYKLFENNDKVKVIAIGMEDEESKNTWKSQTYDYPNFYHVLGLGKWESDIAVSYNIHATPNYFVLDQNKIIIAKPYDYKAVKELFDTLYAPEKDIKNED